MSVHPPQANYPHRGIKGPGGRQAGSDDEDDDDDAGMDEASQDEQAPVTVSDTQHVNMPDTIPDTQCTPPAKAFLDTPPLKEALMKDRIQELKQRLWEASTASRDSQSTPGRTFTPTEVESEAQIPAAQPDAILIHSEEEAPDQDPALQERAHLLAQIKILRGQLNKAAEEYFGSTCFRSTV